MPTATRSEAMEGYFATRQRYATAGTDDERRLLSSVNGMRQSDEAHWDRYTAAFLRGMALDDPHYFDDPSMPAFLKADEPPYYALPSPVHLGEELFAATAHTFLRVKAFQHPDKGPIEVIVPQRPSDSHEKLLIHEAFYPGTQRLRFRDYSCAPFSRLCSISAGTFDSDGVEEREASYWVERRYFDETGTKVIGRRVLNDGLVIADRRDIVIYAHEERTDDNDDNMFPLRMWGRKNSDVTCCTHFNDEGARTHCAFSDGRTSHFTGAAGQERQISVTKDPALHDGVVREFYAGPPGASYMTRQVCDDGTIKFYAGTTPNLVRLVKKWNPSGKTELYEGEHRRERKIGEGFEPRSGAKFAVPSPAFINALLAMNAFVWEKGRNQSSLFPDKRNQSQAEKAEKECVGAAFKQELARAGYASHVDGAPFYVDRVTADALSDEIDKVANGKCTNWQLCCASQLAAYAGLSPEDAIETIVAHEAAAVPSPTAGGASSSGGGLGSAVAGATKGVGRLLLGPPAASVAEGPKPGTQLRVGTDHPRSDLHGKRLALTKPVGGDVWGFAWLDAPEPKLAKGQTAWSIALAQTVTDEAYLAAKAAKEAERAAKAESSKAKKRAQKQAKQLAADAQLAAELQAEEDKDAQPAPPGPPPEGKHHPLKALARCPIDGAPLTDAVLASDGWVYNKAALQSFWCAHEKLVSPITGAEVTNVLRTHNPLRSLAKELQATPANGRAVPTEEPEFALCPITHEVMATPVLAEDGYAYDQAALAQWFKTGATISPLTGSPMGEAVCIDRHMAVLCRAWS